MRKNYDDKAHWFGDAVGADKPAPRFDEHGNLPCGEGAYVSEPCKKITVWDLPKFKNIEVPGFGKGMNSAVRFLKAIPASTPYGTVYCDGVKYHVYKSEIC